MPRMLQIALVFSLALGGFSVGLAQFEAPAAPATPPPAPAPVPSGIPVPMPAMPNPFALPLKLPSISSLKQEWNVTGDIHFETAITLGEVSVLAYNDEHTRTLVLRLVGFDEIVLLDDGPMSGFVAISDGMAVVAFRGTNMASPADWLANIDLFRQKPMHAGCKFHRGFQDSYQRFSETIRRTLRDYELDTIWVTGHSLGGAMAVCCAYDLIKHRLPVSGLVTFGQPRVANPAMAIYLDQVLPGRYLRFINAEDIVPHVPPTKPAFLSDYRHAGELAWFRDGTIQREKYLMQSGAAPNSPFESTVPEVENAITAQELIDLQRKLKATEQTNISMELPRALRSDSPTIYAVPEPFPPPAPPAEPLFGEPYGNDPAVTQTLRFTSRFGDHSMLEYVQKLNEHSLLSTP